MTHLVLAIIGYFDWTDAIARLHLAALINHLLGLSMRVTVAMLPPELNCTSEVEEALRMTVSGFSILWSSMAEKVKHRWFSPLGEVGVVPAGNTRAWFTAAKSVPTVEWGGMEKEDGGREKEGRGRRMG